MSGMNINVVVLKTPYRNVNRPTELNFWLRVKPTSKEE